MNFESVKTLVQNKTARQLLLTQKHSPKILFVAGAVGVVTATVLACRATLKVSDVLDTTEASKRQLANQLSGKFQTPETTITQEEHDQRSRKLQIDAIVEMIKLYALPIGIGLVSITALAGSHVILTRRNGALMATYAGLDQAFKRYRAGVVDAYGKEVDRDLILGKEDTVVEEKMADGSTNLTTKKTTSAENTDIYTILFDETTSSKWTSEPGMNAYILGIQQTHANTMLRGRGHLFLNEVFDMLGLPRTKAGAVVGWVWRRETEEKNGDNFVDFLGVSGPNPAVDLNDFVNGHEQSIWLNFNVDGVILDLI